MSDDKAVRRPTIRDVAALAGVSKSLVALVYAAPARVSAERTRRVLDAAARLGFHPNLVARSLAGGVDFVTILVADLHDPLCADVVSAARDALASRGVPSLISAVATPDAPDGDDLTLTLIRDLRPSGVLVVGSVPDLTELLALAADRARLVVAGGIAPGDAVTTVRSDDGAGIELVVAHLVERRHRRIAFVGGLGSPVAEARERAYRFSMAAHGLESETRVVPCGYSERDGHAAALSLLDTLDDARPTAVVAVNDLTALGVLAAAHRCGTRLAVTGYDNTFYAALPQISLTSVDHGIAEIGRRCADALRSDAAPHEVLVAPRLVVRDSTR